MHAYLFFARYCQPLNMANAIRALLCLCLVSFALQVSQSVADSSIGADEQDPRPNILWLIGEDMGLDLSCYGLESIRTPNIDRLAEEGIRFDNAFCTSSICSPSRSSFNTGMYPTAIAAQDHRTPQQRKQHLPPGVKPISQWFADAGYHTCLMGNPKEDFNFLTTGEVYHSRDWGDRAAGQPFFATCNFGEPHRWVWDPWEKLATHIDPRTIKLPAVYPDDPTMRSSYAKYLDFIVELDRKLGRVLERLEAEGLLDNTIIFFFGDNGRTMYRGKQWLYDGGLRVPLIARYPKQFEPGSVNKDLVSLIDLAPTCLAMAGTSVPPKMQGQIFLQQGAAKREYIFASRDLCDDVLDPMRCVRSATYKYIRNYRLENGYRVARYTKLKHPEWTAALKLHRQGRLNAAQSLMFAERKPQEELYKLDEDPDETRNLAQSPEHTQILNELREELDAWMVKNGDVVEESWNKR